jgi:hypothetical protein
MAAQGLDIHFDGEADKQVLITGEEAHQNPWNLMTMDDGLEARKYLQAVLKGRKLERFYDYNADKRPDVIQQIIMSYSLSLSYTRRNAMGKPHIKFNRMSPIRNKAVIMEIFKVLSPTAKERYGGQLATIARDEHLNAAGKGNVYGWKAPGPPADPETAHLRYRMTNIGTLQKQLPMNVASEVREHGRTRAIKNELMASTWGNAHSVAAREGINTSAYGHGGKRSGTKRSGSCSTKRNKRKTRRSKK